MKKILTFSVCMILALFLSQGNITANAKCAMNDTVGAASEEGIAEEAVSVGLEENKEDDSDEVVENDIVAADEAVLVPAMKETVEQISRTDGEEQNEDCIKVDADGSFLQATAQEQEVVSGEAEEPTQDTENLPADDEIIAGAPPVVAEEEAPAEEVVAKEVTSEKVVTVEPQEIANSGAKAEKVKNNSKKVDGSGKTVQSEKTTAAYANNASNLELPQTGVLDENVFYVLGFFVSVFGIGTLVIIRKGMSLGMSKVQIRGKSNL